MRYAGIIWRVSLKSDGEGIVRVVPRDVKVVCAGLIMPKPESCELQFRNLLYALQCEAMKPLSDLWIAGGIGYCSIASTKLTSRGIS